MASYLDIVFISVIFIFVFGAMVGTSFYLYESPLRSGLKWVIWLGGMFLASGIFNMLLILKMSQQKPIPIIWVAVTPLIANAVVFSVNLFLQWLKWRDQKEEAKRDKSQIRSITNAS